jgi:hypothetical protein
MAKQAKIVSGKGHFFHSMKAQKDNSAFKYIKKLGGNSLVKGYDKLLNEMAKHEAISQRILDEMDSNNGMQAEFNTFIKSTYNYIANYRFYFKKAGIKTYTSLMTAKKLQKDFKKFKKEVWSKR